MFASIKGKVQGAGKAVGISSSSDLEALQRENEELRRMLAEVKPSTSRARVTELVKRKAAYHADQRVAMEDIIDTATEKIFDAIHGNSMLNYGEAKVKQVFYDATGDTIGALESNVAWGTRWKKLGKTMPCTRLQNQELEVKFGKNMRLLYFDLDEGFLNAASYGATPKPVMEARAQWDLANQKNPVMWRFKALPIRLRQAEQRLAEVIGSDPSDTKIVINANYATSVVLKSLPWEVGDRMLIFSCDYDATKNATEWLKREKGVEILEVPMDLTKLRTDDNIIKAVRDYLEKLKRHDPPLPKLANFCHVTSKTAWIFPAKRLCELFHSYGISVMIDGAQAAGHLDINVAQIGADWYLGTVHKWLYSCQGVAFIVTQPHKHKCTHPLTVSYFDGSGYLKEFSYYGLQDFSTWCATIDALDFINNVCGGMNVIRQYCRDQAQKCVALLSEAWGTKPLQGSVEYYGNMPIMPLPNGGGADGFTAGKVMGYLMTRHNITAFLLVTDILDVPTLCVRCSCQIYTDMEDWTRLARAVNQLGGNYGALKVLKELGILQDSVDAMAS
eukprot:TRINITY_DN419_c3_g1_i3.p1 TRINITY_DN419_c3_g1~~TRINITY_DN419_c3_g1_i3.p1  ORF type:complete len:587 (+),score=110.28 TRINITY_DN419_c3_g1_i3:86-1762(+)